MKLIISTAAFFAIFCCFSQIGFTSAKPTYGGTGGLLGGVPLVGGLLGGGGGGLPVVGGLLGGGGGGLPVVGGLLGGGGGGLPVVGGLLGGGGGGLGGLLGGLPGADLLGSSGTTQSNTDNIAIEGVGNSYSSLVDAKGNANVLSNGLL
ncbi:acanthoscurrin-1-like [Episyrphus balteatus]|uniref:acanthoscurrin-1-like n=1 Tax=Episyrphus balteatus TaxID=286459 RepID=UPI0024866023|nr:acanthoscurrin-1-like [Episyrphus balteatus]